MMIRLIIANDEGSRVVELPLSEYLVIDLRSYDEDKNVDSIEVSSEGNAMTQEAPQEEKLFDDTQYKTSNKKPWEFV